MKIGIIGLPQSGKKTLFELLTHHRPSEHEAASGKPIKSMAEIIDPRLDALCRMYQPAKKTRARIDVELLPKLEKDTISKGDIFKDINEVDAVCHIVRAFKNDSVYHVSGSIDPKRDIDQVNAELILNDLLFIEKRFERIEKNIKKMGDKALGEEKNLLLKLKAHLDSEKPLRILPLGKQEEAIIASYLFVTKKPMIVVLNIDDSAIKDSSLINRLRPMYESVGIEIIQVSCRVEDEIANLETQKERDEFMQAMEIKEPAIAILTRLCLKILNLISFFTTGSDEVRQWLIRKGSAAPEAAGAVHTDMEKGFIRAEMIRYDDLINYGDEHKVKEAGKFYLKGKDYIVEDGDILSIRFNN